MSEIVLNDFAKRALRRVSPIYEESEFIKEFYRSAGVTLDPIRDLFLTLREQSFANTVTWGIEYQEHKYSLDPRPDLSLKKRRARLGIKVYQHYPISPARLEKTIYESFDMATYLAESKIGWIQLYYNYASKESFEETLDYLLNEKPAHLDLSILLHVISYIGTDASSYWQGYGGGGGQPVIIPGEIPTPKTEADKKKYPRIFVGNYQVTTGSVEIGYARPEDATTNIAVGVCTAVEGELTVGTTSPPEEQNHIYIGNITNIEGEIVVDSFEKPFQPRYRENPTPRLALSNLAIPRASFGSTWSWSYDFFDDEEFVDDEYDVVKIFFDFPISRHRRVRGVAIPNARADITREEIKEVGQYAVDNKLILNEAGEYASGVTRAALKAKDIKKVF